jgi:hypothetical protein
MSIWLVVLSCVLWRRRLVFQVRPCATDVDEGKVRVPYSQLPFRGLVIRPGSHTCAAVRQLAGTRFLAKEAPRLPLNACDGAACQCRLQPTSTTAGKTIADGQHALPQRRRGRRWLTANAAPTLTAESAVECA